MEAAAPLAMNREDAGESETMALPLNGKDEAQVSTAGRAASNQETGGHETRDRGEVLEPGRALAIADFAPLSHLRWARRPSRASCPRLPVRAPGGARRV